MEVKSDFSRKTMEIWLTQAESRDIAIQAQLKPLYQKYKAQGYMVVVFHSGAQDLATVTSDLLCYNRKQLV